MGPRFLRYEYWPTWLLYLPLLPCYLWQVIRSGAWGYFAAANPGMELGGAFGYSKSRVLAQLPRHVVPPWVLVQPGEDILDVQNRMAPVQVGFPCIAKPDVGERGDGIVVVNNVDELTRLLGHMRQPYVVQQRVPVAQYPQEYGILWYRVPGQPNGLVTSVMRRGLLTVIGDGTSTIHNLLQHTHRGSQQLPRLRAQYPLLLQQVPAVGEQVCVEPIGNHSRGTAFLAAPELDTRQLARVFDALLQQVPQLRYGRFDVKAPSDDHLLRGEGLQILELNGVNSEPAHIYHPGLWNVFRAWAVLARHIAIVGRVARYQHRHHGVAYAGARTLWRAWRTYRRTKTTRRFNLQPAG